MATPQTINQIDFNNILGPQQEQQSQQQVFDKIQAATVEHVVICPVQGAKEVLPFGFEEIEPIINSLSNEHKQKLPRKNVAFPRGTVCSDGRLDMCKQNLGIAGCKLTAKALEANSSIHHLLMGTNAIGNQGAKEIANLVETNQTLETIYLGCNYIEKEGCEKLANAISNSKSVRGLWLKRNPIGPEGAKVVAEMLKTNTTLRTLDLFGTSIGLEGVKYIVDALIAADATTNVERLYLGGLALKGKEAAQVIASLLTKTTKLQEIYINVNFFGDEGALVIADAVKQNRTLVELGFASNGLTCVALTALLDAIAEHPTLKRLDLGRSPSTRVYKVEPNNFENEKGAQIITSFLEKNPPLRMLNVHGAGIDSKSGQIMKNISRKNTNLIEFVGFRVPKWARKQIAANKKQHGTPKVPADVAAIISVYRTAKKVAG